MGSHPLEETHLQSCRSRGENSQALEGHWRSRTAGAVTRGILERWQQAQMAGRRARWLLKLRRQAAPAPRSVPTKVLLRVKGVV